MVGVLPEIVEPATTTPHIGNVVRTIVDRRERITVAFERRAAEFPQRQPVLPLDEIERTDAFDLFQPEPGIVIGSAERRPVVDGHE